jgi:hypothetical protein
VIFSHVEIIGVSGTEIIGVSGSNDVSGLSCDFGCHVPPDVSTLSFKLKAERYISRAASNFHDVVE